jgi:L-ascorbate metabolism protein UlaG (beta-lactamase superfamily)
MRENHSEGSTMKSLRTLALAAAFAVVSTGAFAAAALTGDRIPATTGGDIVIHPLKHATFAMSWNNQVIYVDPAPPPGGGQGADGAAAFAGMPSATIILVTDVHGDHFNGPTLTRLAAPNTVIVAPQAVIDHADFPAALKPRARALANGATTNVNGITIEGVPMYNVTEGRLQFHAKGRGNGYIVNLGGKRVYIAGDTEAHPEMRALRNIDVAFIPMNLPYTMTPEQAAEGVLAFKPVIVYPYHYGMSDVGAFAHLIGTTNGVEVRQRNWY